MSKKIEEQPQDPRASQQAAPPAAPRAIAARAVKTTRGRAATTIEVEVEPERIPGGEDPGAVKEVTAELPTVDDDESAPRWDEQALEKASEAVEDGTRKVRYAGTRYQGDDASRYGVRVRVKTAAGTLASDEVPVRDAGKPEDPDS